LDIGIRIVDSDLRIADSDLHLAVSRLERVCLCCTVPQKNDGNESDIVDPLCTGLAAADTSLRHLTSSPPTNDSFQFALEHATETQSHTSDGGTHW